MHGTTFFPDLPNLARALGGEVANGQVRAPGPGHSAADRSMMVKPDSSAPDGFIVFSHSGDDPLVCKDYVRQRCGLPSFGTQQRPRASREEAAALVADAVESQRRETKARVVAAYDYRNDKGELLYQVVRLEPKSFRQRRPDGAGKWIYKLENIRRVPYRLSELLRYPDACVFICEGEKDADRVASLDHCATTVACGDWTDDCVNALAGRDVLILEDNDEAGREKAQKAAQALLGVAKTIRVVRLPNLPEKGDVSDWLDADQYNASKLADVCFEAPLWAAPETSQPSSPLPFINVPAWHGQAVPDREWCVLNRIPMRNVTLFSGEGAIGKSIVSLQLAVAHVLGRDWLGTMPEMGPALVIACEDDASELHRRLSLIVKYYEATFADLTNLHLLSLAGQDALLATPDRRGLIKSTPLFDRLSNAACDIHPKLIVIDNSADVFGGNENDRAQVRQFIGILRGFAITADAGVLLTSHPSLTGMNSGTGLSGSTAWNASVRSRLWMKRATTEKDDEPDPNLRVIEVMKSNYGPVGETITVIWKDGVFAPAATMGTLEKVAAERAADDLFLRLLDRFTEQGRNVSHARTANNYAPTAFAADPDGKGKRKGLTDAMNRLFAAGKIKSEPYGRASKPAARLVRCG
jgi:RecA-family ATPase